MVFEKEEKEHLEKIVSCKDYITRGFRVGVSDSVGEKKRWIS